MADLKRFTRGAAAAERARRAMAKTGLNFAGKRLWTRGELAIIERHSGATIEQLMKRLPGRTYDAVRAKRQDLGLSPRRSKWTAAEVSRLRALYPTACKEELLAAMPGRSWSQLISMASYFKIRRKARELAPSGVVVLDLIRQRARELNLTMRDIDAMAHSKRYFYKASWCAGHISHKYIGRAVKALDGEIRAEWKEY